MTERTGAGRLSERVIFQHRGLEGDMHGNEIAGDWLDQFEEAARIRPRLGGEEVIAARLAGTQPLILTVRSSMRTRGINAAWRAYDKRMGVDADGVPIRVFEIRSVANLDERNRYIDLLVIEGGAG